jgi:hypothetical protein
MSAKMSALHTARRLLSVLSGAVLTALNINTEQINGLFFRRPQGLAD